MPIRICLAHTPSRESHPLVHPIPHEAATIHPISLITPRHNPSDCSLILDPRLGTACLGPYVFCTGSGLRVARHVRANHLVIDHPKRGLHLTISIAADRFAVVYGQLALFCMAPKGLFLLRPVHVGAVSVVFSAVAVVKGRNEEERNNNDEEEELEIVAVRQTRVKDLRFAGADYLPERTARVLRSSPSSSSQRSSQTDDETDTDKEHYLPSHAHILTPFKSFWQNDAFNAVYPLCTPLSSLLSSSSAPSYPFTLTLIKRIMSQLLAALSHLHTHGVVHGHITRDHVLLDNTTGDILLTGFGHAIATCGGRKKKGRASLLEPDVDVYSPVDTGLYANSVGRDAVPPGVAQKGRRATCNDVWGAGVVLYALLNQGDVSELHSKESREAMVKVAVGEGGNAGESCQSMSKADMGNVLDFDMLMKQVNNIRVDSNDENENENENEDDVDVENDENDCDNDNVSISVHDDEQKQRELIVSLLRGLLQPNPRKRLSARAALEHPALAQFPSSSSCSSTSSSSDQQETSTILQHIPTGENTLHMTLDVDDDSSVTTDESMYSSSLPRTPTSITATDAPYDSNARTQFQRVVRKVNKVVTLVSALQLQAGTNVNTTEMTVEGAR